MRNRKQVRYPKSCTNLGKIRIKIINISLYLAFVSKESLCTFSQDDSGIFKPRSNQTGHLVQHAPFTDKKTESKKADLPKVTVNDERCI